MRAAFFAGLFALVFFAPASAQDCPSQTADGLLVDSVKRSVAGELAWHNGYRQWFGLKLDAPICGVGEVQLIDLKRARESHEFPHLEVYRGCHLRTTGVLGVPGTTYFFRRGVPGGG